MRKQLRSGFTVFELLLVLAILGFLLGLLIPIIMQIRVAAARMQSQNNLKQIGLAAHNYHDANRKFPSGNDGNNFSGLAHMLPYLEQAALFQQLNFQLPATAAANAQAAQVRIPTFLSPLDPAAVKQGGTNYLLCAGSKYSLTNNDGVFYRNSALGIFAITDGTSNTLMAGETLLGQPKQPPAVQRQHVELPVGALANLTEKSGGTDFEKGQNLASDRGHHWIEGRFLQGTFTGTRAANDARPDVDCGGAGGLSGLRTTQKGTNVALCDGSVRFVAERVSAQIWGLVAARNDGQVIPQEWDQ